MWRHSAQVNGLDDADMCAKLYEAAAAGVRIDLIVRGVCRVRPGIPGVSESIRVVSVLGRFLEHHRVYCFFNRGRPTYHVASADWMRRNLERRVEVAVPVSRERSRERLRELLALCLLDELAWEMQADGAYRRPATRTAEAPASAPLLRQPTYAPEQLRILREQGVQGCLMWSIWEKIKMYKHLEDS